MIYRGGNYCLFYLQFKVLKMLGQFRLLSLFIKVIDQDVGANH